MLTRIFAQHVIASRTPKMREGAMSSTPPPVQACAAVNPVCKNLTIRQREVLEVLMQGKSNKAICRALNLAEPTVKNHITAILKELNVTNRTEAVIKAAKASLPTLSYTYTVAGYSTFNRG